MIKNIFIVTLLSFLLATTSYSQSTSERKLGLAQSYEQVGQVDNAMRLYQEVYDEDKKQTQAYEGLVRMYKAKNLNAELLNLIEERVIFDKRSMNYILLGEANWKAGKPNEADVAWDKAIELEPKNKSMYMDLAEIQSRLTLYEKAIKTFQIGRKNIENVGLTPFVNEISKLYIATGDSKMALKETLIILKESGALAAVEARIYAMMQNDDDLKMIDKSLTEFVNDNSSNYMALELYSWYQTTIGNHKKALEYTIKSDNVSKSEGRLVLSFAGNAEAAGNIDISLEAYQYIIDQGKSNKFFASAIYSYTRTLESKFMFDRDMTKDNVKKVIERYKIIIEEYPKSTTAADAYLQIARLQKENLGDYESSEETLYELVKDIPGAIQTGRAMVELSLISISKGELDEAKELLQTSKVRYGRNDKVLLELIDYKLALIEYYSGNLDSAEALFNILSEVKDADIANDVLEKNSIVADKNKEEEKTKVFASAEYDIMRLDTASAIEKYESIINELRNYDTEIWQRSQIELSEIYLKRKNYEKSDFYLEDFLKNLPDGVHSDQVLFKLAYSKELQSKKDKAIELYSKILISFPNSIYLDRARGKIRELRGES